MKARRLTWGVIGLLLVGMLTFLYHMALVEPRRLIVERCEIELPTWKQHSRPVRVALIADLHAALWEGEWTQRIVRTVLEERPDVILLLGDYRNAVSYRCSMSPEAIAAHLRPLADAAPVYYVTGNHDPDSWGAQLHASFQKAGFLCLENRTERLSFDGEHALELRGIPYYDNLTLFPVRRAFPQSEKREEGTPLIAVVHNPFPFLRHRLGADLVFAGHTHGGQICWPDGSAVIAPTGWTRELLRAGLRQGAAGQPVYISRGIGMSNLPFRLNCPPEVSIITLR